MTETYWKNEQEVTENEYHVKLSHLAIRSLLEWLPKNYEDDDELRIEIEEELKSAEVHGNES